MNLDKLREIAETKRSALPTVNEFGIRDLMSMPAYWGWVDCDSGHSRFRMFLGGNDDGVALRFYWNGCYESTTLRAWALLAKKARFVLDIGAHTGAYSLAALAANPDCEVASFEPHFMNFSRLSLNLRSNGFSTRNAYWLGGGSGH